MSHSTDVIAELREHCLPVGPWGSAEALDNEEKEWGKNLSDSESLALFQWLQVPTDIVGEQRLPDWLRLRMLDRAAYWCGLAAKQEAHTSLRHAILNSLQNPVTAMPALLVAQEWKDESVLPMLENLANNSDPDLLQEVANCLLEIATPNATRLLATIVKANRNSPGIESIARSFIFDEVEQ